MLAEDDNGEIGKIVATVADKQYPQETKSIELWHDKMNQAFHSFAYFYYASENRTYMLTINIYDTLGHIIGTSPAFEFPNSAGNLNFTDPISYNNQKPSIYIYADTLKLRGDSITYTVEAYGKFDSNSKCEIDIGATGAYIQLTLTKITKLDTIRSMYNGGIIRIDTSTYSKGSINTVVPNDTGYFQTKAKVVDVYGNTATSVFDVHIADPQERLSIHSKNQQRVAGSIDTLRMFLNSNFNTSVTQVSIRTDSDWIQIEKSNIKTADSSGGQVISIKVPYKVPSVGGEYQVFAKVESKFGIYTDSITLVSIVSEDEFSATTNIIESPVVNSTLAKRKDLLHANIGIPFLFTDTKS